MARTTPADAGEPLVRRLGRGLLVLLVATAPLVFSTQTVEAFEFPKVLWLVTAAVGLATGALAVGLERALVAGPRAAAAAGTAFRREPLNWGVLLFLASAALSTAASLSPRTSFWGAHESFAGLLTLGAYATLYYAAWWLCTAPVYLRALAWSAFIGFGLAAAYGLVQFAGLDPVSWTRTHEFQGLARVFGTMGNPNFLGALCAMGVPLAAAEAWRAARAGRRGAALAAGGVALLALGAVAATQSRGAWVATAAALGFFAAGAWLGAASTAQRWRLALGTAGALAAAAAGVLLIPPVRAVVSANLTRFVLTVEAGPQARPVGGVSYREDLRPVLWRAALSMFRERPLTGVGLDAFQLAYQRHRDRAVWAVEGHRTPGKAHNEVLHVLATQGLPGGVALAVLAAGAVFAFRRALRAYPDERLLLLGTGAALVAFTVQDLFSFTVAGYGTLAAVLLGTLAGLMRTPAPAGERPAERGFAGPRALAVSAGQAAAVLLGAGVLWVLVAAPLRADVAAQRGVVARKSGPGRALPDFGQAVLLNPTRDLHWVQLGRAHYELALALPDPRARTAQLEAARAAFERARALVPVNSYHQGAVARALGELARARKAPAAMQAAYAAFEDAMALDPHSPYWPAEAGKLALESGDYGRAVKYARTSLALDPDYGPAAFLVGSAELQPLVALRNADEPGALAGAFAPVGEALRDAAVSKRWYGEDGLRAVCGSQAAAALVEAGRLEEARAVAELATQVDPRFADARFNLGNIYERLGQPERARHEYQQALRVQPGHPHAQRALAALQPRQ